MKQEIILSMLPEDVVIHGNVETRYVEMNGEYLDEYLSQQIRNHSPDGFNWGYGGSGPAQLALAILLEYLPVKYATKLYQDFNFKFVASLPIDKSFNVRINLRQIISEIINNKS